MRTYIEDSCIRVKASAKSEADLQQAIKRGRLVLHYQPQVDPCSGRIDAVEVSLCWRHPVLGDIPPARFMPVAKTMGLAEALDAWLIREVCEQGKKWQETGAPSVRLVLNVSAEQMNCPGFTFMVTQCLSDSGFDPANLEFVLALNEAMENADNFAVPMRMLTELGVAISIANAASLDSGRHQTQKFPVDRLTSLAAM